LGRNAEGISAVFSKARLERTFRRLNLAIRRLLRLLILAIVSIAMAFIIAFAYCIISDTTDTPDGISKSAEDNIVLQDYVEDCNLWQAVDVGIVTDIRYIDDTHLAVIDGVALIEGEQTRRVKVVKINPDSVDFEYNGVRWSQKINEPSSARLIGTIDSRTLPKHPSVEDIVKYVSPAVVTITIYDDLGDELAFGSGFFIGSGKVLTNAHVVEGAYSAEVSSLRNTYEEVTIDKRDNDMDLAVLSVQSVGEPIIYLADDTDLGVGQQILVIGNPLGYERSVSDGLISATKDSAGFQKIQITAPISEGSSGGPMLNMEGYVVGITYAGIDEGQNLNFAIGIKTLKWFLRTPDNPERLKKAGSYIPGRVARYWIKNIVIGILALVVGVIFFIYILKRLYRLVRTSFRRKRYGLQWYKRKEELLGLVEGKTR